MLATLRAELAQRHDDGLSFDQAWPPSFSKAMRAFAHSREQRTQWKRVLDETQGTWRAAYERQVDETVERVTALEALVA
jgi:hypothetical protein